MGERKFNGVSCPLGNLKPGTTQKAHIPKLCIDLINNVHNRFHNHQKKKEKKFI